MHIVIIGPAHPFRGGIALGNELMAQDFIDRGHQVELITFTKQYPDFLFPGKSQFADGDGPKLPISRKIHAYNPLNWLKVGGEIRDKKPDLVIIRYWLPLMGPAFGTILRKIKKNKHTKIIGVLDNVIPHEKRTGDKAFTKYFLKPIDAFVTMAQSVEKDLIKFNSTKPRTIHAHPIFSNFGERIDKNKALETLKLDTKKYTLLFFGLIRQYKGLDILLDALAKSRHRKDIQLVIAGECYADEAQYHKQIKDLGLENNVVFHNKFIPDSEVSTYFSAADVLVLPYRSATQSGVTQIAYHFDLPMIVSNVGALPDMVSNEKLGLVVEPDLSDFSSAINRFIEDNLSQKYTGNFAEEKQKFSWHSFNEEILNLYSKLIQ